MMKDFNSYKQSFEKKSHIEPINKRIGGSGSGMFHFSLKEELIKKMKQQNKESD